MGYKGLPGFFPPILLQKATGSSKKETRLKMSVSIFENGTGAPVLRLDWWAEPWGWGCQLGSGAGNPLATRRLVFLPFRAIGQYHRPLGKSTDPHHHQPRPPASSVHGFPRQECWSGLPLPSPGNLPDPEIEPESPAVQEDSLLLSHQGSSSLRGLSP